MFRWLTAGESHGRALVAICEGVPAGVRVTTEDVAAALARRRAGYGRGARMTFEQDEVELTAGVRHGRTLGGPVAIGIANTEWPKWETVMARRSRGPGGLDGRPERAADQAAARARGPGRHAEVRPRRRAARCSSGRAPERRPPGWRSARCAGAAAPGLGVEILSHVVPMGPVRLPTGVAARTAGPSRPGRRRPGAVPDPATSAAMVAEIDAAARTATPWAASSRCWPTACRPGSAATALGPPARRPAGRRADGHPGHQGRRGRRRLHDRAPARLGGARRDRRDPPTAVSPGGPTAPAASRAG